MWGLISGLLSVVGGWLGLQKGQQDRYNAPDMVKNKQAQQDEQEKEAIEKTLEEDDKSGNLDKERKLGA